MKKLLTLFLVLLVFFVVKSTAQDLPKIIKHGNAYQLIVDNKPFLMRAGELGNSNASTFNYYKNYVVNQLKRQNINTALIPVYWDLIEPEENKFDFSLVGDIIKLSEQNDIKIVFLWFGAWKNSMSCYVPGWVKGDIKRFPRAESKDGIRQELLSPYSQENLKADKKAFCKLLSFIKENDKNQTVIMIQVENEIAMLPSVRDYSKTANAVYNSNVPATLTDYLSKHKNTLTDSLKKYWTGEISGSWEKVFGKSIYGEEIFTAWSYAVYVEEIAKAGKTIYNLPMYVNCALNRPGKKPGEYPSGGPLPHLIDVWKAGVPTIEMLSPDIYFGDFKKWTKSYFRDDNPFFIPEHQYDATAGAKALYAFGEYHALGFSPFSAETKQAQFMPPVLGEVFSGEVSKGTLTELPAAYNLIRLAENEITNFNGTDKMRGVLLDSLNQRDTITIGGYEIVAKHDYTLGWSPKAKLPSWNLEGAIIINTAPDEFMLIGTGTVLNFLPQKKENIGILEIKEISTEDGKTILRYLNGDESHQGRHVRIPDGEWGIQKFKLYKY
ncbi:MAG: DUF5597 domain-containing protein [Bacteroidales bacterium]|nr:DUF5597 domain-containing protein [Bacteroidales bacterium]